MRFTVDLTQSAERDLEEVYRHVAAGDGTDRAEKLFTALIEACRSLADFPGRGNRPKELSDLAGRDIREAHYKPYRILYEVKGDLVVVHAVLDGRRDMLTLLEQRLMR
jgi:toxin ParE1/3/4